MRVSADQNANVNSRHGGIRFTVVVTTHNYGHLLPDALRSLAAQTLRDFELLIVDDGSTDNTEKVVDQFRSRFRDFHYLKQAQSGPAAARNAGVQEARGTHVAILDADDVWSPLYLETMQNKFQSNLKIEIVFADGLRVLGNGQVLRPVFLPGLPGLEGPVNSTADFFSLCNYFLPSGMAFRKHLYDRIGAFDSRFPHGDDFEWVVRAVMTGAYCARIDQKLFLYRRHGGNLTNNAIAFLETWLTVYEERMKNSRLGPECEGRARNFGRDYVLRLLGVCSASEGRTLLSRTLETLPGDFILRCVFLSTYLGSSYAIRPLKWGKHVFRKLRASTQQVDLTAPTEIIFRRL
jgi:glycosyltransferase involved in cell wall biosynthesis